MAVDVFLAASFAVARDGTAFFATTFFAAATFTPPFFVTITRAAGPRSAFVRAGVGARRGGAADGVTDLFADFPVGRPATLPIAFRVFATASVARTMIERRGEPETTLFVPAFTLGFVILWGMSAR